MRALFLIISFLIGIQTQVDAQSRNLTIDNLSFAGITLGSKMSSVPKTIAGLYSRLDEREMGEEGIEFCCYHDGELVMTIDDQDENGLIDRLYIMVKGAKIANTNIEIGKLFSSILQTPGLVKTKDEYDNELYLYNKHYEVQEGEGGVIYAIQIY